MSEVTILETKAEARAFCLKSKRPVVLVPTMGALHAGHAALIEEARRLAGRDGTVIVSVFVNPTQFGPREDLSRYPRPFVADCQLARAHGADAVFHPAGAEMYPVDFSSWVHEESVSLPLCGGSRPGHFRGVCTVVLKLFLITCADIAVFGWKDFQQCAVIARMVRDLDLPVQLIFAETVREEDGLALSSRNVYLSQEERRQAPIIRQALLEARTAFQRGETNPDRLLCIARERIATASLARIDYVELVEAESLRPVQTASGSSVLAGAVFFGTTRLIDNLWFS